MSSGPDVVPRGGWVGLLLALMGPPRWGFHGVLAVGVGLLLWAFSVPGFAIFAALASVAVLAMLVLLWLVKLLVFTALHRRGSAWFAVGPATAVLVVVLLAFGVPLQARWAMSRDAFEAVVAGLPRPASTPSDEDWVPVSVPAKIGSYRIVSAERVPDGGVIFYEAHGSFVNNAGFAFLPGGPTPGLDTDWFEGQRWWHLGGRWYSWTASW